MNQFLSGVKEEILEKYPQAKPAADGIQVGDVLCNNINVELFILTVDIMNRVQADDVVISTSFVVGNVGTGYHFQSDIKEL